MQPVDSRKPYISSVKAELSIHTASVSKLSVAHQSSPLNKMYAQLALCSFLAAVVVATPTPGGFGGGHKHVTIHVPYKVHTVHHHHVSKVPYPVHVPVVKEVPVIKEVPIFKHVPYPVVQHVPYPVVKKEIIEKEVIVPVHHHEEHVSHGWEGESLSHGWN